MPDDSVNYANSTTPSARRRSLGAWVLLVAVWSVGLLVWILYFAAAIYLLTKAMG